MEFRINHNGKALDFHGIFSRYSMLRCTCRSRVGSKNCTQKFGRETSLKTTTFKTDVKRGGWH
jgi:hypothetical protein